MSTLTIAKLTEHVGAEVTGVDADRLANDESFAALIRAALEEHGVLVFPTLNLDPAAQVAFGEQLGDVQFARGERTAEAGVMRVSLDPAYAQAETLRGAFNWHMDGCTLPEGQNPGAVTILTAVALAERGGETEFASTYSAYDSLGADEIERLAALRVVHTVAATRRRLVANPTAADEAKWAGGPAREHPLIWQHRSGRHSLVIGATAESVVGLEPAAGRALLEDLTERATTPDRVYRHTWSVGDLLMWDNRGLVHRVEPYDNGSPREMIRTSLIGDEPIE